MDSFKEEGMTIGTVQVSPHCQKQTKNMKFGLTQQLHINPIANDAKESCK